MPTNPLAGRTPTMLDLVFDVLVPLVGFSTILWAILYVIIIPAR